MEHGHAFKANSLRALSSVASFERGPSPGDLSNPGTEPASLMSHASAGEFFTTRIIKRGQSGLFSQLKISKEDVKNTYSRSWGGLYF